MESPKLYSVLLVALIVALLAGFSFIGRFMKWAEFDEAVSSEAVSSNVAVAVQKDLAEKTAGRVLYRIPSTMVQGTEVDVPVRISANMVEDLKKGLKNVNETTTENIDAYTLMGVRLQGDDGFMIVPPPEQDQFISRDRFSDWQYKVTPTASGEHYLRLLIGVRVMLPGGHEESRFDPILERKVAVKVNLQYATMHFFGKHVEFFLAMFLFGPAGFFLSRWIERRDKDKAEHKKNPKRKAETKSTEKPADEAAPA